MLSDEKGSTKLLSNVEKFAAGTAFRIGKKASTSVAGFPARECPFPRKLISEVAIMKVGKYEVSESKSNVGTAVTFLMIGVGAGALIALLLAPKTGKQMRRDLRKRVEDARDSLQDWTEDAKDKLQDAVERGSDWAEDLRDTAREKAAPLSRALRRD